MLADLSALDTLISQELSSNSELIQTIVCYLTRAGGKRVRSLLVLLSAKACGYDKDTEHHELAAVIELIHMATLLHDDVVDRSDFRRGQRSSNSIWGNQASVLVGDFLYSRAFQILAKRSNIPAMKILVDTTNQIAEGEMQQLSNQHHVTMDETTYRTVIRCKTAQLFSAAAEIGALLGEDMRWQSLMADVGLHLGVAYQMVDDLMDYMATADNIGKSIGMDLAQGKMTLPLIYAKQHVTPSVRLLMEQSIRTGGGLGLTEIVKAIKATGAERYTLDCAQREVHQAEQLLTQLPASSFRDALFLLARFVLVRHF